jgi:hypothetical protein
MFILLVSNLTSWKYLEVRTNKVGHTHVQTTTKQVEKSSRQRTTGFESKPINNRVANELTYQGCQLLSSEIQTI